MPIVQSRCAFLTPPSCAIDGVESFAMPRVRAWKLLSIACVLPIGCTKEPVKNNPAPVPSASASATSPQQSDCAGYQAAYNDELARSANACNKDADCTCYNGGITKEHGCGGITDKTTAAKIEAIAKEAKAHNCGSGIQCAAWSCMPICSKSGKCENQRKQ
jgi:hypothetical protein